MNCKISKKFFLVLLMILLAVPVVSSEEYKIGPEDVLDISFWQKTDLNTTVRVNQNGTITLDIIGELQAQGKTTKELQADIIKHISRLDKNITQTVVRVTVFNYQYVFVSGQINNPGKYSFEEIPNLWTIINEAGGITEFGDLNRVMIIRGGEKAGAVEIVNVSDAIATGNIKSLPKIQRMDSIEIPRTLAGITSGDIARQLERKNVIYALGAVTTPGPITFEENIDIIEVLALAGGHTAEADLKQVKVISKDGIYAQTYHIDLDKYYSQGIPARYIVQKEDAIVVPRRSTNGFLGLNWLTLGTVAGVITSGILIYNQITPDEQ